MASSESAAIGLSRELIADTSRWRMGVTIDGGSIGVLAYNPTAAAAEDSPVVCREIAVGGDGELQAFEEAVYDNPFLLRDFARVDLLYRTDAAIVAPDGLEQEEYEALLAEVFPDNAADVVVADPAVGGARVVYAVPYALHGFLGRTFYQGELRHPLTALAAFFTKGGVRGNAPRLHVNFSDRGRVDVVVTRGANLLLANTFRIGSTDDALYYVLAVRQQLGLDAVGSGAQIVASGSGELRREVTARLAPYLTTPVMPVIFPTTLLGLGVDPELAPFEVAIMPLCE